MVRPTDNSFATGWRCMHQSPHRKIRGLIELRSLFP